jgi:hypothetical protein
VHLFGRNRDHDYYFKLLREEKRDAQSISHVGLHTILRFSSLEPHERCSALIESCALETGSLLIPHSCVRFAWPVHSEGFPAADITRAGSPKSHLWLSRDSEIHCEIRLQSKRHWSAKIA